MKLYLSGPINAPHPALINENKRKLRHAESHLRMAGYKVAQPLDVAAPEEHRDALEMYRMFMRLDLIMMLDLSVDGLAMMPDSWYSAGATIEKELADKLGMPCRSVDWWLNNADLIVLGEVINE